MSLIFLKISIPRPWFRLSGFTSQRFFKVCLKGVLSSEQKPFATSDIHFLKSFQSLLFIDPVTMKEVGVASKTWDTPLS